MHIAWIAFFPLQGLGTICVTLFLDLKKKEYCDFENTSYFTLLL